MKYPITPDFLAELPDDAVSLYEELERKILQKICEQLNLKGEPNATSLELIRLLQRRGLPLADIEEYIKKTLKLSQTELDNIFQIGIDRNQEYYDDVLSKQQLIGDTARYASIMQEVDAIAQQTHDTFTNLTRSMGFALRGNDGKVQVLPIQKTYQRILDDAEIEVWSGASSYDEAIKNATRRLAESGLQWVDYDSGHHNRVDVAVRRAVMTGITQMSAVYSDNLADELGTPYIEVTAHRGARDTEGQTPWASHKAWQGKVYSRRAGDIYPSVYEICGLGEVDGLCGINCRHHYYPFIEGISERTYTDEELANIDPPPFEFEGKTYTAYEATQKQRQIETTLRNINRRRNAFQSAGFETAYTDESIRYKRVLSEYKSFSKAAGLPEQSARFSLPKGERVSVESIMSAADKEQFSRYKEILGDNAPKTLVDFAKLKYNNSEKWITLKHDYRVVNSYEVIGNATPAKILELDQKAHDTKNHGFDLEKVTKDLSEEAAEKKIRKFQRGNAAMLEVDGQQYFGYSKINEPDDEYAKSYIGSYNPIYQTPAEQRKFHPFPVSKNDTTKDCEYKFFEYLASTKEVQDKFKVTILSEKHICESCESVMEEFAKMFPNAEIAIISGKKGYNGSKHGTDTWIYRKEEIELAEKYSL